MNLTFLIISPLSKTFWRYVITSDRMYYSRNPAEERLTSSVSMLQILASLRNFLTEIPIFSATFPRFLNSNNEKYERKVRMTFGRIRDTKVGECVFWREKMT
jgi:hypothetical protein